MAHAHSCRSKTLLVSLQVVAVLLLTGVSWPQQAPDWQKEVRERVRLHQLETALSLVNERLAQSPGDLEAHGWRGRLLAWQGHWADAESEYRVVLDQAPNDTDVLCGLGDVLLWQGKSQDALLFVERARGLAPSQISILLRRARILRKLGRIEEMRQQFREVLALDPREQEAIRGLAPPPQEYRHEFRAGGDGSTFNYTDPAAAQGLSLSSRWSSRWTTSFATELYQRFGDDAAKFSGGGSLRITQHDWLSATAAFGHTNGSIPKQEVLLEYGHGLRLPNRFMQGLEASYQQHWFWYNGAHVLVLSLGQLYYLPREWTWSFTVTGARSGFTGAGVEWVCSGSTRLEFPLRRQLTANLTFANGTENFAYVDQIGHFSARTYGGGVKYRFAPRRDISGYIAVQDRSQGRRQNSFGVSYGFRF